MKITYKFALIASIILLSNCSSFKESVMPFRNLMYSGESIFPIKNNDSEWVFRAWINNGTSVDRIITVSSDSIFGNLSCIDEIGKLGNKKHKTTFIYNKQNVIPKSGYDMFFNKVDSLGLINYNTQENFNIARMHEPFSLYVVEFKSKNQYNQFSFRTYFPISLSDTTLRVENQYEKVEELLFNEFDIQFYMK
jgi:hypothetical protein